MLKYFHFFVVLLEEPNDVRLRVLLYVVLVVAALRVEHFHLGLNLANGVHPLDLAQIDLPTTLLVLENRAEEVGPPRLLVGNWRLIKFIAQNCDALVQALVDVAQEVKFLVLGLQNLVAKWSDVLEFSIARALQEVLRGQEGVRVNEPKELGDHSEVVDEDGVLVDVLEDAEVAVPQTQLESVLEELVSVYNSSLLAFSKYCLPIDDLQGEVGERLFLALVGFQRVAFLRLNHDLTRWIDLNLSREVLAQLSSQLFVLELKEHLLSSDCKLVLDVGSVEFVEV